jgi:hypothetical protein
MRGTITATVRTGGCSRNHRCTGRVVDITARIERRSIVGGLVSDYRRAAQLAKNCWPAAMLRSVAEQPGPRLHVPNMVWHIIDIGLIMIYRPRDGVPRPSTGCSIDAETAERIVAIRQQLGSFSSPTEVFAFANVDDATAARIHEHGVLIPR